MNELFKKDIAIRILSVLCAVILWLYVQNEVNPNTTKDYRAIRVNILNDRFLAENGLMVSNKDYYINVTMEGRKKVLDEIDPNDIVAEMDFLSITKSGVNSVRVVDVKYNGVHMNEVKIKDWNPKYYDIDVERIDFNSFPVDIVINGEPREGYVIVGRKSRPNTVDLRGAESLTRRVDSVVVEVDVSGLDRDISLRKECKVLDSSGNEIVELQANLQPIDVDILVAKEVPLVAGVEGEPQKGYAVTSVRVNPDRVQVTGDYQLLAELDSIRLDPVDVEGLTDNAEKRVSINLPQGLSIVNGYDYTIFTAVIEPLYRVMYTLDVAISSGRDETKYKYSIPEPRLQVVIMGTPEDLAKIRPGQVKAEIDVGGLGEGLHNVPVKVGLPDNLELEAENYYVNVLVEAR